MLLSVKILFKQRCLRILYQNFRLDAIITLLSTPNQPRISGLVLLIQRITERSRIFR